MIEVCGCQQLKQIKIEGDVGAEALWCAVCGYNLDLEDINISQELKTKLNKWSSSYAEWMDWETETLTANAKEEIRKHNDEGQILLKEVQKELKDYEVSFKPTTS